MTTSIESGKVDAAKEPKNGGESYLAESQHFELAKLTTQADIERLQIKQQQGFLGRFIGGGSEKPTNIAFLVIVSAVVLVAIDLAGDAETQFITIGVGIISTSMGYIFGDKRSQSNT